MREQQEKVSSKWTMTRTKFGIIMVSISLILLLLSAISDQFKSLKDVGCLLLWVSTGYMAGVLRQ